MPLFVRMYLQKDHVKLEENSSSNQPSVNKTVQHFRCLLYQVRLVGVVLQLIIRLQVQDHVQRLPVVGHLLVQPRQIKLVLNVVLVNLAEELIPSQATKPRYPRHLGSIDRQL